MLYNINHHNNSSNNNIALTNDALINRRLALTQLMRIAPTAIDLYIYSRTVVRVLTHL